jgi:hypothetical protein
MFVQQYNQQYNNEDKKQNTAWSEIKPIHVYIF